MKLERKIGGLESIVTELCSALLYCDDVELMERHARQVGDIYRDADYSTIRRPRMLRQELVSIMNENNMSSCHRLSPRAEAHSQSFPTVYLSIETHVSKCVN